MLPPPLCGTLRFKSRGFWEPTWRENFQRGEREAICDPTVDIACRRVKGRGLFSLGAPGLGAFLVNHISWRRNSSEARKCCRTMRLWSVGKVELKS